MAEGSPESDLLCQDFSTPSGKVELFSERIEKAGLPPVPFQGGSLEGAIAFTDTVADGALIGMSGERTNRFTHTQFHNIPSLLKRQGEGYPDLHPEEARKRNITDGQPIEITTPRGRVRIKAGISDVVHPGSIRLSWGWGKSILNAT